MVLFSENAKNTIKDSRKDVLKTLSNIDKVFNTFFRESLEKRDSNRG